MALEKIRPTTFFQRMRRLIMGSEKPNLLTRVSVTAGFVIWLYLFSWQLLNLLSILLMGNLEQSPIIRSAYNYVGYNDYGYTDTTNKLLLHSSCQIIVFSLILASLILIWRNKKIGFLTYVVSNLLTLVVTFFIMGFKYMQQEILLIDYILLFTCIGYFSVGLFIFYKKKKKEVAQLDSESNGSDH